MRVQPRVAVVGAGPAGLMAAETLARAGVRADVYDRMPSAGRKFLLAGKGGLNLTHSEPPPAFLSRYGQRRAAVAPWLEAFGAEALRAWAGQLGIETFVGSSGRVFPRDMKAAPLLRAWLHRLREAGVRFYMRHRWVGWSGERDLVMDTPTGSVLVQPQAVVLALGGGSWSRLGSDGAWVPLLTGRGVAVQPLLPANCGFDVARPGPQGETVPGWSEHLRRRFAGLPVKPVVLSVMVPGGERFVRRGEFVLTDTGIEGSLIYAASSLLREAIAAQGWVDIHLDLMPDWPAERVLAEVAHPRGSRSWSSHLQSRLGLKGLKVALLHEVLGPSAKDEPVAVAAALKALPLRLVSPRPLDEAISSAGGVRFESLDEHLMLRALPGVFCAGEMLDWEAPTGGYLLTACFASGRWAGEAAARWLGVPPSDAPPPMP
ncbi:MAG: NAD(P)/FAD-dependent oxidoreductase [Caldimonas sp.]|uniref:NAD(P)/FAD-dependent oxidoreductase n=1 Tax=Caldimonas sp. TaxID=2838790 RepID=UPI00391D828F